MIFSLQNSGILFMLGFKQASFPFLPPAQKLRRPVIGKLRCCCCEEESKLKWRADSTSEKSQLSVFYTSLRRGHLFRTSSLDLYIRVGWPLYRKYGHAIEAFRLVVNDPDSVLNSLTLIDEIVKDALVTNIRRRMTPQPLKIRADVEMKCFEFDGVLHIKAAMRKAQAVGSEDCPVKVKLVAAPSYVLITQTLDKEQGISVLTKAIAACTEEIELHKGNLTVKQPPKVVSEREDILLDEQVAKLSQADAEAEVEVIGGDDDNEDEEDTRIGDVDLDIGQEI